jgi:hypothetical protein
VVPAVRRITACALGAALLVGGAALPATADTATVTRSNEPDITISELSPAEALGASVAAARKAYSLAVADARAARTSALATPRAELALALEEADTKAERRLARRTYAKAVAPIEAEYQSAKKSAAATRDAAIDEALAVYLVATGKPEVADALETYRRATATARDTLELALKSGRETFRTDTADERAALLADLEAAETEADRAEAWKDFVAATADEGTAHSTSIAAARATYRSALAKARAEFKASTGISIRSLQKLPVKP